MRTDNAKSEGLGTGIGPWWHPVPIGYWSDPTHDIPAFVDDIVEAHSDVDCLINSAVIQRPFDRGTGLDLAKVEQEIDINIRGPVHLAVQLFSHLKTCPNSSVIMDVSKPLSFVPNNIIKLAYNGTKAFLHFRTMDLRTQLEESNNRVIEIAPPTVKTDLCRERAD